MGDELGPAPANSCRHATSKDRRLRQALALAALAVAAAAWPAAGPVHSQGGEPSLQMHLVQAGGAETLQVTVAPTIVARPASQAPLAIRIGGPPDALPKNSFLRVRGLPPTVSLSEGYVTAPGAWSVPLHALSSLQMIVPTGVAGRAELSISLVTEDGALLAQARTVLAVEPPPQPPPPSPPKEVRAEPPKAQSPPVPRPPMLSPADREAAERLIARGEREIEQGNVAVARQFFLRAAQLGLARGAMLLASTYDPRELTRLGVQGMQPNLSEARKWYERARELGAPEAEERLARLGGG
jgi:hypothetical protein